MSESTSVEALAAIPARGGSKGIPRKNILPLAGKPLIAHTIEQAHRAANVTRVAVSTDDPEIAAVSGRYGAEVIRRPAEISGDGASSESALLHALDHLREAEQYEPDIVVFLQCTSPLTLAEDIDGTVGALLGRNADSALAVTPFHYFLWRENEDGNAHGINHHKSVRPLRQEREPQFLETGAIYVMRTAAFREARHRFFGRTAMYVMPPERCLEIDEPVDLRIAELLMRERRQGDKLQGLPRPVAALILDFDGVFTDNRVTVFQDGREAVVCDRSDGMGLARLSERGLPILVISAEQNPVVQARCGKLGVPCVHGVHNKLDVLTKWLKEREIDASHVVYVGNDVNDVACLERVGCGVVVSDAHPRARAAARIVLSVSGGRGAVREISDLIDQQLEEPGHAAHS